MKLGPLQVVKYTLVTKRDVVRARIDFCQFFDFLSRKRENWSKPTDRG
jgi:hypothetical protein